jgi:hypothetical protein
MPKRCRYGQLESQFDPSRTEKKIYNTFRGFHVEALPAVQDEEVAGLSASIYMYILTVLANGDVEAAKGLTDWIAHLFLHPGRMSGIAPLLYGVSGCRHKEFVDWIGSMLVGPLYTVNILGKTKFKKHEDFLEKLLIHEHGAVSRLVYLHIRDQAYLWDSHSSKRIDSYHNVIFTTTNRAVAVKACDSWKIGVFHCAVCEDYAALEAQMLDPRVQRAFYQSLLKRDVSGYLVRFARDFVSVLCTTSRGVTV